MSFVYAASLLSSVKCIHTNLEEDPEGVDVMFSKFLATICSGFKDSQDQVEQVIVNQQNVWFCIKILVPDIIIIIMKNISLISTWYY